MSRDFSPDPEELVVVLIDTDTLCKAESLIESCERCDPGGAKYTFDWILDQLTGRAAAVTDYLLEAPAKCPSCRAEVHEKTFIRPE